MKSELINADVEEVKSTMATIPLYAYEGALERVERFNRRAFASLIAVVIALIFAIAIIYFTNCRWIAHIESVFENHTPGVETREQYENKK